ncbi:hypothetical protein NE615_25120, partial [Escherichia coli]|nr:hypothetical protein [Escherichia coli]
QKLYLSPILDLFNGEIVAWETACRPMEIFAQQVRETMERRAAGLKPPAWAAAAFESGLRQSTEEEKSDSRAA